MRPFTDPVLLFIPIFVFSLIGEYFLIGKNKYDLKDAMTSIGMGLGNLFFSFIFSGIIWWCTLEAYQHRVLEFTMTPFVLLALVLCDDFIYYWFHRISHESRIWWAAHVNHHSSEKYNLSTALRQHWSGNFVFIWVLWLPLSWIGFDPRYILLQKSISLLYQYWIHTELIDKLPFGLETILNTPSHHRAHHGSNVRYLDCNYGGIFIIWDRWFGTFTAEDKSDPVNYGLTTNIHTHNLLIVAFHEWKSILHDIKDPSKRAHWLGYVFGPPGWSHGNSRQTSKQMKAVQLKSHL